jgi:uncharacterized protein (DUF1697 family)
VTAVFVALLRGINVGRSRQVGMAQLRELLESLGHRDVRTHLRSGNAVFTAADDDAAGVGAGVERALRAELGFEVRVLLRSPAELEAIVSANPFPAAAATPQKLHVAFLSADPAPDGVAALDTATFAPDELLWGQRAVYLWYPDGVQGSRVGHADLQRLLGVDVTMRNWNTVTRLAAIASEAAAAGQPPEGP